MASELAIRRNPFDSMTYQVDYAMLGCKNAVRFYRTSAVPNTCWRIARATALEQIGFSMENVIHRAHILPKNSTG